MVVGGSVVVVDVDDEGSSTGGSVVDVLVVEVLVVEVLVVVGG